jgi:hypothetical protein
MSHIGFFFFCVSFSPSLLRSFSQLTHTHKPAHGHDTCAMLRNTQKATINGIGTQRNKRGYKGGASCTYAKVRRCQNTRFVMMSMNGGVKTLVGVPMCQCQRRDVDVGAVLLGTNKARNNRNPNTHINSQKFGAKSTHKICQNLCQDNTRFYCKGVKWMSKGIKWC